MAECTAEKEMLEVKEYEEYVCKAANNRNKKVQSKAWPFEKNVDRTAYSIHHCTDRSWGNAEPGC